MATMKDKIGGVVHFKYFTLPYSLLGRGGVDELFMAYHGIESVVERLVFPYASPDVKKSLIESGESPAGTLPVATVAGENLCGHIAIMRYFEKKMGIVTADDIKEFRLDELAGEYTSWRDSWVSSLGGDPGPTAAYKAARSGFYDLMEAFYVRQAGDGPFYLGGDTPRYPDFAIVGIMSDDQTIHGVWDYTNHPSLGALWAALRKSPALSKFFS